MDTLELLKLTADKLVKSTDFTMKGLKYKYIYELHKEMNKYKYPSLNICDILGINSCKRCAYRFDNKCLENMEYYISNRARSENLSESDEIYKLGVNDNMINDSLIDLIEKIKYTSVI
jgi:hypothetical protein